jgi:hypothetical protein
MKSLRELIRKTYKSDLQAFKKTRASLGFALQASWGRRRRGRRTLERFDLAAAGRYEDELHTRFYEGINEPHTVELPPEKISDAD